MAAHSETEKSAHSNGQLNGKRHLNFVIIGAGSRGNAYASALTQCKSHLPIRISGIAEPVASKAEAFKQKYISQGQPCKIFDGWQDYVAFEKARPERVLNGGSVNEATDGVFVCILDGMHEEAITALAPLGLNIMSEKPLATTLSACLRIYRSLRPLGTESSQAIFSIGHVLRYSPHNMLLRRILLEEAVIGDVLSIEHTEPVGWWHFSHSYVRGNWRKESTTAPSLLTKSCHDIDLLLWLLCSLSPIPNHPPHLPSQVTSMGSLLYHKKAWKPALAGDATNCLSCPAESKCLYSAKKIYEEDQFNQGNTSWPVNIVDPEIEDLVKIQKQQGGNLARRRLLERLSENYDDSTPQEKIDGRPWFGRCVYESANDVCDDQVVTMMWEDDPLPLSGAKVLEDGLRARGAKIATFHMVASTEKQCERRGRVYGTRGEIEYDSKMIRVYDFQTKRPKTHHPHQPGGGHGGGDAGLTQQFVKAIEGVQIENMSVAEAQQVHIGCTVEEAVRSHAMVFAAEEARREKKVVSWADWWQDNVQDAEV